MAVKFKRLSSFATTPTKATKYSAGFDFYAAHDAIINGNDKRLINTDIALEIPSNYYGRIAPRSGFAYNNFLDVGAGVVDSDYRGNVGVLLFNFSKHEFYVKRGMKIAQIIFTKILQQDKLKESKLNKTKRNEKGFGSSN